MNKYKLKKEIPGCGEGMVFHIALTFKDWNCNLLDYYTECNLLDYYTDRFERIFIHKDLVENNPKYFEKIK